ncbi:dynein heavy chain, partial [Cystoisospora suis]
MSYEHVMVPTPVRLVESTVALLKKGITKLADHQTEKKNEGEDVSDDIATNFLIRWLVFAILWGCGGSLSLANRVAFSRDVEVISPIPLPSLLSSAGRPGGGGENASKSSSNASRNDSSSSSGLTNGGGSDEVTLLDFEPRVDDGEWHLWKEKVKQIEIEPQQV